MKITLINASKAAGVFNKIGEQMLPGRIAKVIFTDKIFFLLIILQKSIKSHFYSFFIYT